MKILYVALSILLVIGLLIYEYQYGDQRSTVNRMVKEAGQEIVETVQSFCKSIKLETCIITDNQRNEIAVN